MAIRGRAAVATVTDIDAQIASLEARKRELHAQEAERLRLCAERVGLNTMALDEAQLEAAFKDLGSRCLAPTTVTVDATRKTDQPTRETAAARD